jgi:hypothetical protein
MEYLCGEPPLSGRTYETRKGGLFEMAGDIKYLAN